MAITSKPRPGSISGHVIDCGKPEVAKTDPKAPKAKTRRSEDNAQPISFAEVALFCVNPTTPGAVAEKTCESEHDGGFKFENLAPGHYWVRCRAFEWEDTIEAQVTPGCDNEICFEIPLAFNIESRVAVEDCTPPVVCDIVTEGRTVMLSAGHNRDLVCDPVMLEWSAPPGSLLPADNEHGKFLLTAGLYGKVAINGTMRNVGTNSARVATVAYINVMPAPKLAAGAGWGPGSPWVPGGTGFASAAGNAGFASAVGGTGAGGGRFPNVGVMLQRSSVPPTPRLGFWARIRNHAKAVSFGGAGKGDPSGYQGFIDRVLCEGKVPDPRRADNRDACPAPDVTDLIERARTLPLHGMTAYELLMTATEIFLLWNCGVVIQPKDAVGRNLLSDDEEFSRAGVDSAAMVKHLADYLPNGRLPYIERVVRTAFPGYVRGGSVFCANSLSGRADCICLIELIWSYWLEEGMLAQTLNAISRRFQNIRAPGDRDPLAHLEIDPLRALNNLLWGYLQNEPNQLTVKRRAYEYDHHYGLTLYGKAVPALRSADSRSKFIEGFHNLLHRAALFYKEDNDTTVIADGFPLINALKEVHLLLAQGAHNQFGDLPWTARVEMMVQQWLLARPEMRDFLQSRAMVPYTEAWMPQVDTMKTLQGWSDVTITHFRDLAVYGEQILLSVRYDDWIELNDENEAKNWARYWRPEIQSYIHGYRTVTGVDLTNPDTVDATMPAVHLRKRLALQQAR